MNPTHSIKGNLARIHQLNPCLADELAKLPEIRDIRSKNTRLALDNLLRIYRFAPPRFDHMLTQMLAIGLPASRRYCAPLQAFFWVVEDEKMEASGLLLGLQIIASLDGQGQSRPQLQEAAAPLAADRPAAVPNTDYTLEKILDAAWNGEPRLLLQSTIQHIIHGIAAKNEAEEYTMLAKRRTTRQLQGYIMDDYLKKREIFSNDDWSAIACAIAQSRWKQFYTVADRLNSPELVNYYINKNFYFRKTPASGVYFTFFEKKAQCTDAAFFTQFMLARAGYRTFIRSVKWDEDPWDGLHTGAGIILDDGSYLLVSSYTGINAISGPFTDALALDQQLSCNRSIIHSQWGAYYPPRYY